jgi:peroxiredoxin
MSDDVYTLPPGLPVPEDDGAADHLLGTMMPQLTLESTQGPVSMRALSQELLVLYVYPRTGRPGVPSPEGWDAIPGARGCTPEACAFRDHHADLLAAGASAVFGLSSQDTGYQSEFAQRTKLPFELLADPQRRLGAALRLPTFAAGGMTLYRRLTLVVADSTIEHVFYPVFPPDGHAEQVLGWLRTQQPHGEGQRRRAR